VDSPGTLWAEISAQCRKAVEDAASPEQLEAARVSALGRKGRLTEFLKSLKDLPLEEKRKFGPLGNSLKTELENLLSEKEAACSRAALDEELKKTSADLTLPAYPFAAGRVHPLTAAMRELGGILSNMGFAWAEGPLVETEFNNFEALNIPAHHPARDMHDTLYLKGAEKLLFRTHTSPVQVRTMLSRKPPLRIISPGRVFRSDAFDASHSPVFHQIEGLYVDRKVSMADLKATLAQLFSAFFGKACRIRFRPSYFPFVEPGAEADASCVFCGMRGCSVCKQSGWVELSGAGIVHPKVLEAVGIDPQEWSGFAFGMGVERLAMLKYGITDIRAFYENDLRVLRQF